MATAAVLLSACDGDGGQGPPEPPPPPPPPPTIGDWIAMAPMPQVRSEHSAAALDGKIYVAAGFTTDEALPTEFFIYDAATDSWSQGAPIPFHRHHAAMVAHNGKVYLIGGYTGVSFDAWTPHDRLFIYDVPSDTWSEGQPMPGRRGAHAAAVTADGMFHVVGGVGPDGPAALPDEHFIYDTDSGTWSTAAPLPVPREHLGAAYHDGTLYVATGRAVNILGSAAFQAYDVATDEWSVLAEVPTSRSGVAVVAFGGQVYVFGGETSTSTFNAAERYDPASGSWEVLRPMPTSRHGLGAGVVQDAIYVIGGGPEAGFSYSAVNERWTP